MISRPGLAPAMHDDPKNGRWTMGNFRAASLGWIASAVLCLALTNPSLEGIASEVATLPSAPDMALGGDDDRPTTAWKDFCRRLPAECAVDLAEPAVITLTPETWALIKRVNLKVNQTIEPITDRAHWGVNDRWDFPDDGKGDCEDIQLLKRKLLSEAGLPRRAMRMTVVIDKRDAGHAVLTVRTDKGDLILDNETDKVLTWDRTGYEFVKREGADGPAWVALGGEGSPIVVASRSATRKKPTERRP
jgi:predicted transglutaminase-like cysteine proteinase